MALPLIVGGTVAIDHVKTPTAEAPDLLGGSASYAALAASYHTSPVHLVGIVGHDFPPQHLAMLEQHGVTLHGLERSDQESFTWTGEYHDNMNERTTHAVGLNVLENWSVNVPSEIADAPVIVLANMSPDNQAQMLDACTADESLVIADSMDLWIQIAREKLAEVMQRVDIFVINDSEAKELCGTNNLMQAGAKLLEMGPQFAIIKLGEFGAMLFGRDGEHFRTTAYPLEQVADPTGAGDSFLGGLAGYLAAQETIAPQFDDVRAAIVQGTLLASYTCEDFSTRALEGLSAEVLTQRHESFKNVTAI